MSSFPKQQHLKQPLVISELVSHGKTTFKYPLKAFYAPSGELPRYAISVPKKHFKRAVKRNLLKRRIREAIRLNQGDVASGKSRPANDYLIVYVAHELCPYDVINAAVRDILSTSNSQ